MLRRATASASLFLAALLAAPVANAQTYPHRVQQADLSSAPYNSTGLFFAEVGTSTYRGSAVVARDKRLLYSCAHVLYDEGVWATTGRFARAWHGSESPTTAQMLSIRGYRYYATYAGGSSAADFATDFAIAYRAANTSFGPVLPWITNGSSALASATTTKLILGYPVRRDYDSVRGYYFQHETGPFTRAMAQASGSYHTVPGVSTGGGNSGGPVVAYVDGAYRLVGVLVSGSTNSIGVHGLNRAANQMASNALADLEETPSATLATKTATNSSDVRLPDAATSYTTRTLNIADAPASSSLTKFSLRITAAYRGDLDVYVRSPVGRIRWVQKHSVSAGGTDLVVKDADISTTFSGTDPNGTWKVHMRDYYRGDRATFNNASLTVGGI